MAHHHLCQCCGAAKVPCDGTWERNHDGEPEVICASFHLPNGELNPECICDACGYAAARYSVEREESHS